VWIAARSSLHPIHTETDGLEGWLDLELGEGGRVDLGVEPGGHLELPVARLRSGNPLEDRELRRRIDARRHPTIAGDLTRMEATEATATSGRYRVEGNLTFKGVTRHYEDEMTLEIVDGVVSLSGEKTFDVRDFGMEPPRILLFSVAPDVRVRVAIVAETQDD
jgi:polyisoprenoid-binding protein YceI